LGTESVTRVRNELGFLSRAAGIDQDAQDDELLVNILIDRFAGPRALPLVPLKRHRFR
jgi:hypothetical protein